MTPGNEIEVLLPTNEADLDEFVTSLTEEFNLPAGDDTYDAIATMILHLPSHCAYVLRSHFGNGVLRAMANSAAYNKCREFSAKREAMQKERDEQIKAGLSLVRENETPSEQPLPVA